MAKSGLSESFNIDILSPSEADKIDASEWNSLGVSSLYPNPFYQRWCLLPALHNLVNQDRVYVITIRQNAELIGLFPVTILNYKKSTKYLSMWNHDHCLLNDPLLSRKVNFRKIINKIGRMLNVSWVQLPMHNPQLMNKGFGLYKHYFYRAAITDKSKIQNHLESMKGKDRREIRRVQNKINSDFDIKHIEHENIEAGMSRYSELEYKGWKGRKKGSILSNDNVKNYYFEMASNPDSDSHIVFHELWADKHLVAISIRFKQNNSYYDIKTCYDEDYKNYCPGKILELKNLSLLESESFDIVDSCTSPENALINKLWHGRIKLQTSHVFFGTIKSQCWHLFYMVKKLFFI